MLNQSNQVVFGDETDDSSAPVGDWESAVLGLACFVNVIEAVDGANGNDVLAHELLCSDKTVAMWNGRDQNWHLFGSDSFFIQTPVAKSSHEIRHAYSDDDWNEDIDVLRSLHNDNHQRICHSGVPS